MNDMNAILHFRLWGNTPWDYAVSIGLFAAGLAAAWVIERLVLRQLRKYTERTPGRFDNFLMAALDQLLTPLLFYGAFAVSIQHLELSPAWSRAVSSLGKVLFAFLGIRFAVQGLRYALFEFWLARHPDDGLRRRLTGFMPVLTVLVWMAGLLFLLDNLGFKITAIIAGLGIGGAAVALASQSILGDLFSYFSITVDRPFEIGDFITVGDFMGSVEHIGIKTTRVRSLSGELLIFSNRDLTDSRIRNYKQMQKRRIQFNFAIAYETPLDKLKEIPGIVRKIVEETHDTQLDRAHFFKFDESALNFEVVYFVLSSDYNLYMDIQQEINLRLKEAFDAREIKMAYPTRSVRMDFVAPGAFDRPANGIRKEVQPASPG